MRFSEPPTSGRRLLSPLVWVAFAIIAAAAVTGWLVPKEHALPREAVEPRPVVARGDLAADEQNAIEVFRLASPSTVHIRTAQTALDFFSLNLFAIPKGSGTGFIWDRLGHIVTNFHVIEGADRAYVTLTDQSTWQATIVGAYPDKDLAVLRIGAPREQLHPILIGESRSLQVGQRVYAIGNPFTSTRLLPQGS